MSGIGSITAMIKPNFSVLTPCFEPIALPKPKELSKEELLNVRMKQLTERSLNQHLCLKCGNEIKGGISKFSLFHGLVFGSHNECYNSRTPSPMLADIPEKDLEELIEKVNSIKALSIKALFAGVCFYSYASQKIA